MLYIEMKRAYHIQKPLYPHGPSGRLLKLR
nr:MAG TPA: hypothetical protein [Caudoviricetes sp.]